MISFAVFRSVCKAWLLAQILHSIKAFLLSTGIVYHRVSSHLIWFFLKVLCWGEVKVVHVQAEVSEAVVVGEAGRPRHSGLSPWWHGHAGHLLDEHLRHLPGHLLLHLLVVLAADQLLDSFTDPETDSSQLSTWGRHSLSLAHLEVFLVPSFLFIWGARSQPGS